MVPTLYCPETNSKNTAAQNQNHVRSPIFPFLWLFVFGSRVIVVVSTNCVSSCWLATSHISHERFWMGDVSVFCMSCCPTRFITSQYKCIKFCRHIFFTSLSIIPFNFGFLSWGEKMIIHPKRWQESSEFFIFLFFCKS